MKKLIVFALFLFFVGITIFIGSKLLPQAVNYSGIQVIVNGGESDIYLDGRKIGESPYENEKMHPGDYVLKISPKDKKFSSWSRKITLTTGAMTTVERTFSKDGKHDGGLVVYLRAIDDKMSQVEVISNPDDATLFFDKESKGNTPFIIKDVITGNHEVIVKKNGYEDKIYKIDSVPGFSISMNFDLVPEDRRINEKVENKTLGAEASSSGNIKATISPTPSPKKTTSSSKLIEIGDTGTGWLRVRSEPSTSSSESAKVNSGEKFSALQEENGWIKIEYQTGLFGWISSEYVKKL